MDEWKGRCIEEQVNGWMDQWMDGWTDDWVDGWMDGYEIDVQMMDRYIHGQMDRWGMDRLMI